MFLDVVYTVKKEFSILRPFEVLRQELLRVHDDRYYTGTLLYTFSCNII